MKSSPWLRLCEHSLRQKRRLRLETWPQLGTSCRRPEALFAPGAWRRRHVWRSRLDHDSATSRCTLAAEVTFVVSVLELPVVTERPAWTCRQPKTLRL